MKSALLSWQLWALRLPGLQRSRPFSQNVNSDFATFIRIIVILCALGAILASTGQWPSLNTVSRAKLFVPSPFRSRDGRFLGLLFPSPKIG